MWANYQFGYNICFPIWPIMYKCVHWLEFFMKALKTTVGHLLLCLEMHAIIITVCTLSFDKLKGKPPFFTFWLCLSWFLSLVSFCFFLFFFVFLVLFFGFFFVFFWFLLNGLGIGLLLLSRWGVETGGHLRPLHPVFLTRSDGEVNEKVEGTLCDAYSNCHTSYWVQSWTYLVWLVSTDLILWHKSLLQ